MSLGRLFREIRSRVVEPGDPRWIRLEHGPASEIEFLINPDGFPEWDAMAKGNYDRELYELLDSRISLEDQVIWDVGAHMGYHTLALAKQVGPEGRVIAFEPNPAMVDRLRQNVERNAHLRDQIEVVSKALADTNSTRTFRMLADPDDPRSTGGFLESADIPLREAAYRGFRNVTVTTARADTLVEQDAVAAPTLIKIDVEGAEAAVLSGARHLLESYNPVLFVEIHSVRAMYDVAEELHACGYHSEMIEELETSPSRGFLFAHK